MLKASLATYLSTGIPKQVYYTCWDENFCATLENELDASGKPFRRCKRGYSFLGNYWFKHSDMEGNFGKVDPNNVKKKPGLSN